ncbi:MAG: hypothetical protein GQE15_42855 [Archangiaceae bacterium]|nr:hypothetical protein [Archangiaceae bacterium]
MPSRIVFALCTVASFAFAEVKPAAIQLCVELPLNEPVFVSAAGPKQKSVGRELWMLDFDVRVDGVPAERVTKVSASCLRAWVSPRKVKRIELDFSRLANNFTSHGRDVAFDLKSDLLYDAGSFVVEQEPFATISTNHPGTLVLERLTANGPVPEQADRLPVGEYRVSFRPEVAAPGPCETKLEVATIGTVTPERQPALFEELKTHYEAELLPDVLSKLHLTCDAAEVAVVHTKLVDGVFSKPFEPLVERHRLKSREPTVELKHQSETTPMGEPLVITVGAGQHFDIVTTVPTEAEAAATPALSATR